MEGICSQEGIEVRGCLMCWSTWEIIEFLGLTLAIFASFVLASCLIFGLLDRGFSPITGSGKIINKFLCQHHYRGPMSMGVAVVAAGPMKTSTTYKIRVRIAAGDSDISVSKRFYNRVSVDDFVHVKYSVGRFSEQICLWKVWNQSG
jgi:hypothetical protein